jgi:anti-sigma regulatory factor (Ser/Thr protein kinase)
MNELTVIPAPVVEFTLRKASDVAPVVAEVFRQGLLRNFPTEERGIVGTVVSELATNIVKYAGHGLIRLQLLERNGSPGVRIEAIDQGPSIPDIEKAMEEGFSTGGTLGMGLPAVRRLTDSMEVSNPAGGGTRVNVVRWCRRPEASFSKPLVTPQRAPATHKTEGTSPKAASGKPMALSIQTWERPKPPLRVSGDRVWWTQTDHYALLVHLDALGHGAKADSGASIIVESIQRQTEKWPGQPTPDHLIAMLEASHLAAMGTVGASIALVLIDRHQNVLHHLGVGNISLLQFSPTGFEGISRTGTIGQHYRRPQFSSFPLKNIDRFVTFSDGLSCSAIRRLRSLFGPQTDESVVKEHIIKAAKISDDSSFILTTCFNP